MKILNKFEIGDVVEFYGHGVSCEAERERYEKKLCPAQNSERHLKVGEKYLVVATSDKEYGFYIDIQGIGVNGDQITVHGCSSSNFIKANKSKMKITNLVKKILDKDTRTLVKAGFINGDLALTDEGTAELLGILFMEKKSELLKVAEEKITENETN